MRSESRTGRKSTLTLPEVSPRMQSSDSQAEAMIRNPDLSLLKPLYATCTQWIAAICYLSSYHQQQRRLFQERRQGTYARCTDCIHDAFHILPFHHRPNGDARTLALLFDLLQFYGLATSNWLWGSDRPPLSLQGKIRGNVSFRHPASLAP